MQRMGGWFAVYASQSWAAADKPLHRKFDFAAVKTLAQTLARRPFQGPAPFPDKLRQLTYDQYRLIAFRHERALWREPQFPFWVEFFHRGFVHKDKVDIFVVHDGEEQRFPFDPALFQYRGDLASLKTSPDWGYSGWRLLCRLPARTHQQEFCTFQGASYFRAICTNQVYGASARGLAVNCGLPRPEEFPSFRTFWLERPSEESRAFRAWALLDGPSVTGAYAFLIKPGREKTTLDIDCQLFFRRPIDKLGVAPMSSMWAWDTESQPPSEPRPQVHDSDGLLLASTNGEWLWRPLERRAQTTVSRFQVQGVKGFGLMQRDREPDHYRDGEAKYHLRPSVWIQPREPWGAGAVEVLELPTETETNDNIAAFWAPKQPVGGDTLVLAYRVAFAMDGPEEHRGGRFLETHADRLTGRDLCFRLVVESTALRSLAADTVLQPVVTANRGRVTDAACTKLPSGAWQLRFRLARTENGPTELRAFVRQGDKVLTETWSYLCT
jgi:glucans biosynthesis protein